MTYKDYINRMKTKWCGALVRYEDAVYTVTDVDYNGALLIDKPARFTPTTAVSVTMVKRLQDGKSKSSI